MTLPVWLNSSQGLGSLRAPGYCSAYNVTCVSPRFSVLRIASSGIAVARLSPRVLHRVRDAVDGQEDRAQERVSVAALAELAQHVNLDKRERINVRVSSLD